MKRPVLIALLAGLLAACSKTEPSGPGAGEAYYRALNCRACHRIGTDGGTSAPDLTYVGFRHSRAWLDRWLANPQAWKPDTMMPNPRLSEKARAGVVDFLSAQKGQAFAGSPPWDDASLSPADRGHVLFAKAGCIACHGKGGAGGYPNDNVKGGKIPALDHVFETFTKDELVKKITDGVKPQKEDPAGPEPLVFMPPWGQVLKPEEISAVADYLLSLRPASGSGNDAGF